MATHTATPQPAIPAPSNAATTAPDTGLAASDPGPSPASFGWLPAQTSHQLPSHITTSFEVMPPRNPQAAPKFWTTVKQLVDARPNFISVTYGAAGQDRRGARAVTEILARHVPTPPIAHLTCVGTSIEEITQIVTDYLDSGVRTFLALRGDPPVNKPGWSPADDALVRATDLIHLIREVDYKRSARSASLALQSALQPIRVAVATFPGGNPAAGTTPEAEVERLVHKQVAGADFAISQFSWHAAEFTRFVELARAAGVTIPIVPGILPPTQIRRVLRTQELTGVEASPEVLDALARADSPAQEERIGVRIAADLALELLDGGAPGVHLYTFNKAVPALAVMDIVANEHDA
ncbi:MAG: methylenetetrahydrofolate reductase [Trueperella sp.]|uniref:methylenetetrahydrofolate reductase n=1 Tax=Trueperella sp. TaxID=2699835 RepID=UPI0025E9FF37|nr:methylenetetrahydrofolate reductase [Trueperella sp.]MCI7304962.1 methylenetetrahydrofolate reductase [Trueperella sp.]MDY5404345.1 methylenetetrahydrofolate reductase [Trueperella sp.]